MGIALAVAVTRLLESALFGISPLDPAPYGVLTAILSVVVTAASYVPARAATRVEAVDALRSE